MVRQVSLRGAVHLVDDDPAVQRGVAALLLAADYDVSVFSSGNELLQKLEKLDCHQAVFLIDVSMPGIQGLDLQEILHKDCPGVPVIVMTAHGDVQMAVRAMKNGAIDFLEKPFSAKEIVNALERALSLAETRAVHSLSTETMAKLASLTSREREVLDEIVAGNTSKVIARNLGLSPRTVEVHRQKLMQKMDAANLADLVRMVVTIDRSV